MAAHACTPPTLLFIDVFLTSLPKTSASPVKVPPSFSLPPSILWFRVGFSGAITQTQPVSADNSCLLFNTVQRATRQAKLWKHFFIPTIFLQDFNIQHFRKLLQTGLRPQTRAFSLRIYSHIISKKNHNYQRGNVFHVINVWSAYVDIHHRKEGFSNN